MLVLNRKIGASIRIGEEIRLTILEIDRGKVRLGIEAPKAMGVWREELVENGVMPTSHSLPPAPRTEDGRREEINVDEFYDDGIKGGLG